jgi:hypothetical protein
MRNAALVFVTVCCLGSFAAADMDFTPQLDVNGIVPADGPAPRLALSGAKVHVSAATRDAALDGIPNMGGQTPNNSVEATATDGTAHWIMTDVREWKDSCKQACPAEMHASFLWEKRGSEWNLIVWDVAAVVTAKQQAAAIKKNATPSAMPKKIDAGAEDVVKLFETSIADPKAFAATVSARKDVVLYGNEAAERAEGGAKVKAKLEAWKLGFKVRDGIQAGLASKTVAWVAANVDSTSVKKPKDKPVPYRVLAIYEKTGAEWKLVHANFAYLP